MQITNISFDLEFFDNLVDCQSNLYPRDVEAFRSTVKFILDELDAVNLSCNFFVTGEVIENCPDVMLSVLAAGHRVGFHSMRHSDFSKLSSADIQDEIDYLIFRHRSIVGFQRMIRLPGYRKPVGDAALFYASALEKNQIIDHSDMPSIRFLGMFLRPGGTVFRVLPLPIFKLLFRSSRFTEIYLHPRDLYSRVYFPGTGSLKQRLVASLMLGNPKKRFQKLLGDISDG